MSSFIDFNRVKKGINSNKFECLKYRPGGLTSDTLYLSPEGSPIEVKQNLRDLGVQLSDDCTFTIHIDNVVTSVSNMVGWVLRTFRSRSKLVMYPHLKIIKLSACKKNVYLEHNILSKRLNDNICIAWFWDNW